MNHSITEIIKALNVVKDICSDKDMDCFICPFRRGEQNCMFTRNNLIPKEWDIAELPEREWRAFK